MTERFRQSIAKRLLQTCPAIVRREIDHPQAPSEEMVFGSLVDSMVFGGADKWTIVDAPDWRTKKAREAKSPTTVLAKTWRTAEAIADRVKALMPFHPDRCQREVEWTSGLGVECRGTPDYWYGCDVYDLKLVDSAHPSFLQRQALNLGWHIQAAAYREALHATALMPLSSHQHIIIVAERNGSGTVGLYPLSPELIDYGQAEWERAQMIWQECQRTGEWPGYQPHVIEAPKWLAYKRDGDAEDELSELGLEMSDGDE